MRKAGRWRSTFLIWQVSFLNQLILTRDQPALAHTLLLIYLSLFANRASSAAAADSDAAAALNSRMLSRVLSGIHRAVPFCDDPGEALLAQLSTLFRCTHAANFSTAVQALMVLAHTARFAPAATDRFYRALYAPI